MTDDELQQFLDDPQMQELMGQMAFAKRTFKSRELRGEAPDVEEEWAKFAATHFGGEETMQRRTSFFSFSSSFQKIAACFIGVLLVTGMAYATIRIVRHSAEKEQETVAQETRISTPEQEKLLELYDEFFKGKKVNRVELKKLKRNYVILKILYFFII